MKKVTFIFSLAGVLLYCASQAAYSSDPEKVGASTCMGCHSDQVEAFKKNNLFPTAKDNIEEQQLAFGAASLSSFASFTPATSAKVILCFLSFGSIILAFDCPKENACIPAPLA